MKLYLFLFLGVVCVVCKFFFQKVIVSQDKKPWQTPKLKPLCQPFELYFKDIVYGGLDGIITTFAIVSGVVGARLASYTIISLGLANLFADGLSMAVSNYLSSKSEKELMEKKRKQNTHQKEKIMSLYRKKGIDDKTTQELLSFTLQSLNLSAEEDQDATTPTGAAMATFSSFVFLGSIPLLPFFFAFFSPLVYDFAWELTICSTIFALVLLGSFRGLVSENPILRSASETVIVGGLSASVAFYIGQYLQEIRY